MIYLLEILKIAPGKMREYLELHEKEEMPLVEEYQVFNLVGTWITEFGESNEIVEMWKFGDFATYDKWLKLRSEDKKMSEFYKKVDKLVLGMNARIVLPAPFSPLM